MSGCAPSGTQRYLDVNVGLTDVHRWVPYRPRWRPWNVDVVDVSAARAVPAVWATATTELISAAVVHLFLPLLPSEFVDRFVMVGPNGVSGFRVVPVYDGDFLLVW